MKPNFLYLTSIDACINLNYVTQVSRHKLPEIEDKARIRICLCDGNEVFLSEDNSDVKLLKEILARFNIQLPPDETAVAVCTQ